MTEEQIASIQYAADWLSRSEDIGNRKHGERLRAILSASIADWRNLYDMVYGHECSFKSFMMTVDDLAAPPAPSVADAKCMCSGLGPCEKLSNCRKAPSVADAAGANPLADSPLVKKYRRDCWLRNHAYERAARTCEAILAFGFVGNASADRFEWTAKECARIVRQLKDHEEFANKHEETDD